MSNTITPWYTIDVSTTLHYDYESTHFLTHKSVLVQKLAILLTFFGENLKITKLLYNTGTPWFEMSQFTMGQLKMPTDIAY